MNRPLTLEEAAAIRTQSHATHASQRPLAPDYDTVGVAGEHAFAQGFGLPDNTANKPFGDKGVDFELTLVLTVDVKTSRKANYLLVEEGKAGADIYVLAAYDDQSKTARLVGWEWGRNVRRIPPRDTGRGVINHFIPRDQLRPMVQLKARATT